MNVCHFPCWFLRKYFSLMEESGSFYLATWSSPCVFHAWPLNRQEMCVFSISFSYAFPRLAYFFYIPPRLEWNIRSSSLPDGTGSCAAAVIVNRQTGSSRMIWRERRVSAFRGIVYVFVAVAWLMRATCVCVTYPYSASYREIIVFATTRVCWPTA